MKRFALPAVLIGLMMVAVACEKKFNVAPSAAQIPTATPTVTRTSTPAPTSTATFTPSSTPTFTSTPTLTGTYTLTPVNTSTPTDTATVTDTPTPTVTFTSTPTFVCTVAVINPVFYSELEPLGVGGSTNGTNDTCGTAENVGTVSSGNALVISGSLASVGTGTLDLTKDEDYYIFTVGSAGVYNLALDCYSSGADSNLLDLVVFDSGCNYLTDFGASQPVEGLTSPALTPGTQLYVMVIGANGSAPVPYHLEIIPP